MSTRTSAPQPIPLDTLLRGSSSSSTTSLASMRPSITFTVSPPETELTLSPSTHGTLPGTLLPSSPSTPVAASPYSSTRRIASSAAAPICPTPGQPNISTQEVDSVGWRLRKWLHIRTWWQGSFAVITLVIGVLGLVYSAYRIYNLARWTAAKDFYEQCQYAKVVPWMTCLLQVADMFTIRRRRISSVKSVRMRSPWACHPLHTGPTTFSPT